MEIERKWLVAHQELPMLERVSTLEQFYTECVDREVRYRHVMVPAKNGTPEESCYYRTEKVGSGMVRQEVERKVSHEEYEAMYEKAISGTIYKVRGYFCVGGYEASCDRYITPRIKEGIVEIEFPDVHSANNFSMTEYYPMAIEVTDVPEYKNKNIAKRCPR